MFIILTIFKFTKLIFQKCPPNFDYFLNFFRKAKFQNNFNIYKGLKISKFLI